MYKGEKFPYEWIIDELADIKIGSKTFDDLVDFSSCKMNLHNLIVGQKGEIDKLRINFNDLIIEEDEENKNNNSR